MKGNNRASNDAGVFLNGGTGGASGPTNGMDVQGLCRFFEEVQEILEQNWVLIQEINQNHEAHEAEDLNRNVALIHELHTNIDHVVDLYNNLSCTIFRPVTTHRNFPSDAGKGYKRQHSP